METLSPLIVMETAITQKAATNDASEVFPLGRQGLTVEQAIETVTIDAAYFIRMEDRVGSIEVGKYADLVILEQNLFEVQPEDIDKVKVMATLMNGRFTYREGM